MRMGTALRVLVGAATFAAAAVHADEIGGVEIEGVLVPPGLLLDGHVALPATPGWGGGSRPSPARVRAVRLSWTDPTGSLPVFAANVAREETARVFRGVGLAVQWVEADPLLSPDEIRVILLDRPGACDDATMVLGSTPRKAEKASHVWVHLPSVMAVIGFGGRDLVALDVRDRRRLGLALGRVVAHEIVHALAPEVPHGSGLMATRLSSRDLTAPAIAVPIGVVRAIVAALSGGGAPAALSAGDGRRGQPRS